jgi:hypothetical protein
MDRPPEINEWVIIPKGTWVYGYDAEPYQAGTTYRVSTWRVLETPLVKVPHYTGESYEGWNGKLHADTVCWYAKRTIKWAAMSDVQEVFTDLEELSRVKINKNRR